MIKDVLMGKEVTAVRKTTILRRDRSSTPGGLGKRPLLTVGMIALIATATALFLPPIAACIAAGILLMVCLCPLLRRRWGVLLTAAIFLLSAAGQRYTREIPLCALDGQTDTVTARVVAAPRTGQTYTVEVLSAHRLPAGSRLALYFVPGSEPTLYDTVTAHVSLKAVPSDAAYRRSDRVFLYAFPEGEWNASATITDHAPPRLYTLRRHFDRILRHTLPDKEGALLSALCLGQRTAVSTATEDAFRYSGLSHLLVVSGLHLSMVAVALRGLLRRIGVGYRLSAALTLPLIWSFAGMVGGASSVLRAAVMGSLWLMSFIVFRRYDGLNAWGLAAGILLLTNPYRLLHAGFQLSFAATAGVLTIAPRLCRSAKRETPPQTVAERLWRGARWYIRNGCAVCIGALLFTLPLTVFYYRGVSLTTLLANLLAVVPAGWALTLGWLGMLCGVVPLLGWLSQPLLMAAGLIARWLQGVACFLGPQWVFVPTPHLWLKLFIAALCGILVCGILCRIPRRRVLAVLLALTLCVCAMAVPLTAIRARLTVIPCGNDAALLVQQGRHTALFTDHSRTLEDVIYQLEQRCVTQLDYVFIQEGATADGATLAHIWAAYAQPTVYTADANRWYGGTDIPITLYDTTDTWSLWRHCTLTRLPDGWWRWDVNGNSALVGTDPAVPRPEAAALTVYTEMPRTLPDDGACIVSLPRDTAHRPPCLCIDEPLTLIPQRNKEWSVLPWL